MLKGKSDIIDSRLPKLERQLNISFNEEYKAELFSFLEFFEHEYKLVPLMESSNNEDILFKYFTENWYVGQGERYNTNKILLVCVLTKETILIAYDSRDTFSRKRKQHYSFNDINFLKNDIIDFLNDVYPKYDDPTEKLNSTSDLLDVVNQDFKSVKCIFRGQHFDNPLLPKFARQAKAKSIRNPVRTEERMLESFKKQSIPYLHESKPTNDWDWLALAQHYGLPTRLLDWSANAFVALWFSVHARPIQIKSDSVLWILKIEESDYAPTVRENDVFGIKRTYLFQPSHLTSRIESQSGWFTVHRYKESKAPFVSLETNKTYKNRLKKYSIPYEASSNILLELYAMGITERTLFPGLESLSKEIDKEVFKT